MPKVCEICGRIDEETTSEEATQEEVEQASPSYHILGICHECSLERVHHYLDE